MTRLSLSPESEAWQHGRFRLVDQSDSESCESSYVNVQDDCVYSSDSEDEDDYQHPVGFPAQAHASWGRTRFSLDPTVTPDSIEKEWERLVISPRKVFSNEIDSYMQSYPPLNGYVDPKTAPTTSLIQYDIQKERRKTMQKENERDVEQITQLLQAASIVDNAKALANFQPKHDNPLAMLATTAYDIQQSMEQERRRMKQEHLEGARALQRLLDKNQAIANDLIQEAKQREDKENARLERERREEDRRRRQEQADQDEKDRLSKENRAEQQRLAAQQKEKDDAAKAKEAAKTEYIVKAKKLVLQLQQLRASIEPFEKSKAVSKRRLNMKKVVRGKVNTLAENAEKIKSVAAEVGQAITAARAEDDDLKKQIEAGNNQIPSEMTRGKRYLVDLLASSIMVRVQAEGFNGVRGDGFPMASMLAMISVENKELIPILAAHIYTVCPTAIPKLPSSASSNAGEEALMKSLGMAKDKKGEYETFDRFLLRTEGIISLVADIMASNPPNHLLLGGNKGAVEWLTRFLDLLPAAPQSPLPLLTAPVLDAFLTGAGHMLANMHPEEFKRQLDVITSDIIGRLDEGAIGQPSATRLKKTIRDGFEGFKNNLPSKALAELYYGAAGGHVGGSSQPAAFGTSGQQAMGGNMNIATSAAKNPFGASNSSNNPNPFGYATSNAPNPFGAADKGPSPSPFGQAPITSSASSNIFGQQQQPTGGSNGNPMHAEQPPNSFGISSASAPSPFSSDTKSSPFGGPSQSPFGQPTSSSTPFGPPSNPFGSSNSQSNPFGGGTANSSPFGAGSDGVGSSNTRAFGNSQPSPFGSNQQQQTPFGGGGGQQQGGFGGNIGNGVQDNSFGSSANTKSAPFGAPSQSPFGQPSSSSTPFGASPSNPFGSSSGKSNPFGGGNTLSNPFGTGSSSNTPFGSPQPSLFGGNQQQQTPFGGSGGQQQGGFGGNNRKGGQDSRPPCKFFAKGQCKFGNNCRFSHAGGGNSFSNVGRKY